MSDFDVIREALDYADHALPVPAHESAVAALSRNGKHKRSARQVAQQGVG